MNVVVSRNESQKIYQRIECDTSLWIKQAIIQLIVLILFRQSGVLSVCISRAILITQEVPDLPYTIIMHTSTVTLLLGLGGVGGGVVNGLPAHYIVMKSNVRVDQHKSQTSEGESRRTVGG